MKKILLIKLGGSIITDKKIPYKARPKLIRALCKELKYIKTKMILAHGSGSFGHTSAIKFGGKKGYRSKEEIAKVARDAMEINRIVMDTLVSEKLPAISIRPMSIIITDKGVLKENFFRVIEEMLNQDLIPVIYGDVIWDKSWRSTIYSGEKSLNKIGSYLMKKGYKIDKIIEAGETDGVYNDHKETIPLINKKNWAKVKKYIYSTDRNDVTGGMKHKIEDALIMAKKGIKTFLINGSRKEELKKAILGKQIKGTVVA